MEHDKSQSVQEYIAENIDNSADLDLTCLYHPRAVYTPEQKIECASLYMSIGSVKRVSQATGVPEDTIKKWIKNSPWWEEIWTKLRKEKQMELDQLFTNTIHKAVTDLGDRIANGDYKLNMRTGEQFRVPLGAKDLAVTLAIIYDKRALIRGEATSIKQESSTSLQVLEDKFKSFALQLKEKDIVSAQ